MNGNYLTNETITIGNGNANRQARWCRPTAIEKVVNLKSELQWDFGSRYRWNSSDTSQAYSYARNTNPTYSKWRWSFPARATTSSINGVVPWVHAKEGTDKEESINSNNDNKKRCLCHPHKHQAGCVRERETQHKKSEANSAFVPSTRPRHDWRSVTAARTAYWHRSPSLQSESPNGLNF